MSAGQADVVALTAPSAISDPSCATARPAARADGRAAFGGRGAGAT